ncbi:flagellar assembly peptidoglycan hydrolase FlgJ [Rheinheimera tangshanensis]|uniref:Peptidoglycan hydrolase FlgJ n=1 Tax=Rheinheimera tangshanensis TaxID=400153 RepID=A0A5C8LRT3_9GAMM|nr:flagellar assembly peptidoglycan hydrolase FlgJ [Rheinheimera tangshanensis]TXK78349.1 flagellar assembly peptidoglycan hydrolase FlgJ [Rheinheimera tangshanensis]GGM61523.1 flagellar rod assembly protein/muramidase FlgJ [Rheinheimera tangshanensis]
MSQVENKVNYHDLTGLAQLKHSSGGDDDAALKQAAKQFESIFMGMLLSSMRKANEVFEDDGVLNSNATKFYQDMYDKQLSTELSEKGSLGLADLLVQQLRPTKGKTTPASMLKLPTEAAPVPDKTASADTSVPAIAPAKNTAEVAQPIVTKAPQVITETLASEPDPDNEDWSFESPGEFIQKLMPAAKQAAQKLGLEPLALLAQAALETGWGQRTFKTAEGNNSFNFFGIKAHNSWQGDVAVVDTLEYRQGVAQKEKAKFRAYESPEQSLGDYVDFIKSNPRYQQAVAMADNPKAYFQQLQAAGYATDPNYAQKILAVFNSETFKQARNLLVNK